MTVRQGISASARMAAIIAVLWVCRSLPAAAAPDLRGKIELSAVQSDIDGNDQHTLRQNYNIFWSHAPAPRLKTNAFLRYYTFDIDQGATADSRREEYQPGADLSWQHPDFNFRAAYIRRETELSTVPGTYVTDDTRFSVRSTREDLPLLRVEFSRLLTRERDLPGGRDNSDSRLRTSLNRFFSGGSANYQFSRRWTENLVSGLDADRTEHRTNLDWSTTDLAEGRLALSSSYSYRHVSHTDEVNDGGVILDLLTPAAGLHSVDPTPDLDPLEDSPGLIDGDFDTAVLPVIDVGGVGEDNNIGVDLGFAREVSAVYVHTDRPSGLDAAWSVFVSDDNIAWRPWTGYPSSTFNTAQQRYEIEFPYVTARYLKIVAEGGNEVARVLVTELSVLQPRTAAVKETRTQDLHLADIRAAYSFSERVTTTIAAAYLNDRSGSLGGRRENLDTNLRLSVLQGDFIQHLASWNRSSQNAGGNIQDILTNTANYTLQATPLPTLRGSLSATHREEKIDGRRSVRYSSATAEARGTPLPRLETSIQTGFSRSRLDLAGDRRDNWYNRFRLSGSPHRSLNLEIGFGYQRTSRSSEDGVRHRRNFDAGFNLRLTGTINARGNLYLVDDRSDNLSHNYLLSWHVVPRASLVGQAFFTESGSETTDRYSAGLTIDLNRRSNLYFRYSEVDFTDAGGTDTVSFQQGIRIGF